MAIVSLQESELIAFDGFDPPAEVPRLEAGTRVEVQRRFDAKWARGFEVIEFTDNAYRLRRLSDGATLPVLFPADEVRRERRNNTWWI
jgi:hypothetical protein